MTRKTLSLIGGFVVLFALYHAAEYMIVFQNSPAGFLGFQLLFFVAAWLIGKKQFGKGLAAWGLRPDRKTITHCLLGLLLGLALYGGAFAIALKTGIEYTILPSFGSIAGMFGLFLFGNLFSSFSEDVLTRGYIAAHFRDKMRLPVLLLVSATVYVLNHIYRLADGPAAWTYLFLLGVLFVIPLLFTKRLWLTGCMHWAGNVTFYYTHELAKTTDGTTRWSYNYVLMLLSLALATLLWFYFTARARASSSSNALAA